MVAVTILCDDRFDENLTYDVEGEVVAPSSQLDDWCRKGLPLEQCEGCMVCIFGESLKGERH